MNTAIIGLGSNIEPEKNIEQARRLLCGRFTVKKESEFIETEPVGYQDQDNFINGAVLIETDLTLNQLTSELKHLEKQLGRQKSPFRFGPRTIDLDIVVFNSQIIDQDFYSRDFLKSSVLALLPDLEY